MQAWEAPGIPRLPGTSPPLRLYDTAAREVRATAPDETARMYVCGITPYDATHLGHAATYLAFDLVNRMWRDAGHDVVYVQNVTDVDDPLLERAVRDGEDWQALAAREIALFRDDMSALAMLPPEHFVGAVEAIEEIADFVVLLQAAGAAYEVDGDVYFSVAAEPRFGAIGGYDVPTMLRLAAERGGDPERPGKKDPLDPVLWRAERSGEPSWPSPLGRGRPGWHVECSAIAVNRLGMGFDVQGGGSDLVFPHHECSAAHAQVGCVNRPFARHYVHTGMIGLRGEKMSKSRGNLVLVSRLHADGVEPVELRLALLSAHYRTDRDWTSETLDEAAGRLARWRAALSRGPGPEAQSTLSAVRAHLSDDLDARGALQAVDRWAHAALTTGGDDPDGPGLVRATVDALLGLKL
ncbi:MAG: cysteine--1-D-myo-inosityl 2-amino-2-deoxy-alpha-D-glucopyranoside ligase [Pseudonocardiales bacterium]